MGRRIILDFGLLFWAITSCINLKNSNVVQDLNESNCNNIDFAQYNPTDSAYGAERMAVISSFIGDYYGATEFATKNEPEIILPQFFFGALKPPKHFIEYLDSLKQAGNSSAILLEYYITQPIESVGEVFKSYSRKNAEEYILSRAKNYHFLLINEAHYCGQHRAYTKELLEPLWELGYRYLALEGLRNNSDSPLPTSPPKLDDGYYLREVNYGLLLREAYRIGFKVVPYESINSSEGTAREEEQAFNIFNNTLAMDSKGKVIVHAGYSHINENGDVKFRPMANMLKSISKKDIFSIDQQNMIEMLDEKKMNPFYKYAIKNYQLDEASVFIDQKGTVLVDPINCLGIDIQVYHPKTKYTHGRPHWMITSKNKFIALPPKFAAYKGLLVEARLVQEDCSSVPLDRLIISDEDDSNYLLLEAGSYVLMVFDKSGKVIDKISISVD